MEYCIEGLAQPVLPYFTVPMKQNKETKRKVYELAWIEVKETIASLAWLCGGNRSVHEYIQLRCV